MSGRCMVGSIVKKRRGPEDLPPLSLKVININGLDWRFHDAIFVASVQA